MATLGGATEIGSLLFFVTPPKVAKASTQFACWHVKKVIAHPDITDVFAKKLRQCRCAFDVTQYLKKDF
jgi:hypothetical protein